MPELDEDRDGAGGSGSDGVDGSYRRRRCSCLPFCFWRGPASSGGLNNKPAGAPANKRQRRRRLRLSWLITWPWFGKKKAGAGSGGDSKNKGRKRRGRRLLLLLTTSLQPKKALASVVSGDSALLPAKVSSFGDAKKKSNRKPRPTVDDGPSGSGQPQASTTASTGWSFAAPPRSLTEASQPSPRATDSPGVAGRRMWRAPSRQHYSSFRGSDSTGRPGGAGGLWTAATTLGVIVFFGRATAVIFLCSCLYGARFVRGLVGGASASAAKAKFKNSGVASGSSVISTGRRSGDPVVGVAAGKVVVEPCATDTEECKKKVVMAGLLDRAGKTPTRASVACDH